ncbi:hypothetical protein O181_092091 [Austropuccinia psidii MF-1]|uniref:Uncharacterized protein n=1 Tax=Austropuccinia psidii MF-1 TaxID=1389203 RepID=A0A9Q3IYT6_9BASI|nr:hypothetical protein [Austropuccinia psidii MF-1]
MRPKGDKGIGQQPPSHKWAHLRLSLAKPSRDPKWPKAARASNCLKDPTHANWPKAWPLEIIRGHQPPTIRGFPLKIRDTPGTTQMDPSLWEPEVVHIWSYIPLCTIFPHTFNGNVCRTKLFHSKPSPQVYHPFQRWTPALQSYNLWW